MLLIWGWRTLPKTLDEGTFYCPRCDGDRQYRLRRARRFFTFFFIPIIPLKVLGEYVECSTCGSTFDPQVLTLATAAQMEDTLTTALRHAVVSMISADGVVQDSEKQAGVEVVRNFARREYSLDDLESDLATLAHADLAAQMEGLSGMLNEHGKESLLAACVSLASADGHVDPSELELLEQVGVGMTMSRAHVRGVIHETLESSGHAPAS